MEKDSVDIKIKAAPKSPFEGGRGDVKQSSQGDVITRDFLYHALDPEVGGYMSVHLGSGQDLVVLTTPVSTAPPSEHRKILESKIEKLCRAPEK